MGRDKGEPLFRGYSISVVKGESIGAIWGSGSAHSSVETPQILTANLMNNGKKRKIEIKSIPMEVTEIKRTAQDCG